MRKPLITTAILFAFLIFFAMDCKKEEHYDKPSLPPSESMVVDFNIFITADSKYDSQKGIIDANWQFASHVATIWRLIILNTISVPIEAYKLALYQNADFVGNKTWQWNYTVPLAGITFKTRLTGEITATGILWKMYLTRLGSGGFTEFLWVEGSSKPDGTAGQWKFYQSWDNPVVILQADWTKSDSLVNFVKYIFIKDGDPFKASYIEYGLNAGSLDAYYNVHYFNSVEFSDANVEWNKTEYNGRVKSREFLGDMDWHCWDGSRADINCP
jgi:hypothetical protein